MLHRAPFEPCLAMVSKALNAQIGVYYAVNALLLVSVASHDHHSHTNVSMILTWNPPHCAVAVAVAGVHCVHVLDP